MNALKVRHYLLIIAWSMAWLSSYAQSADDFKQQLLGTWEGKGQLFGQTATFSMKWETTLNARFLGLKFQNGYTDGSGAVRQMQAHAYYNLKTNKGNWFDSRGKSLPLVFTINGNSMTVFWGDEATEKGKTTYRIQDGAVEVEDFVYKDGSYAPFGRASYRKKE